MKSKINEIMQKKHLEVYPDDDLNDYIKKAKHGKIPTLIFREGTYSPKKIQDALIFIDKGINIIGYPGENIIFKGNGKTKHIIVVGPKVTNKTLIANISIIEGNTSIYSKIKNFNTNSIYSVIDGGGILTFGSPIIFNCIIENNFSIMCGGGISIQHPSKKEPVKILNCTIQNNEANHTGGGIDVLTPNSSMIIKDSIIKNNLSNKLSKLGGISGQVTVFPKTFVDIENCKFYSNYSCSIDYSKKCIITLEKNHFFNKEKIIIKDEIDFLNRINNLVPHLKLLLTILYKEKFRYYPFVK